MPNRQQITRRRFLLRTAGATLALPALPSLTARVFAAGSAPLAQTAGAAAATTATTRIVAIGNLLGFYLPEFFPAQTGKLTGNISRTLAPLAEYRNDFSLFAGLDHGVKGGHFAVHSFLSGVLSMDSKGRPEGNITMDQRAAETVAGATRFPSLSIGSETGIHGGCQMCWTRSGTRVPPIPGARELFNTLFVNESTDNLKAARDRFALKGSILDAAHGDAKSLGRRLDSMDRDKLDEYFTSIRDVETQLQQRTQWIDVPKPEAPFKAPQNTNMVDDLPLLYDLIVLALQTDSTRIATLEIGGDFESRYFDISSGYHSLSHHGKLQKNIDGLLTLEAYQLKHFARFIGKLKSIPEGDSNLLDHTQVLFGSGMSDANKHSNLELPVILAGGRFKTHGEYRQFQNKGLNRTPLCNLYLSLLQNFGVEIDQFGTSTSTFTGLV